MTFFEGLVRHKSMNGALLVLLAVLSACVTTPEAGDTDVKGATTSTHPVMGPVDSTKAELVEKIYETELTSAGWMMPAGDWTTQSFSKPIGFRLPEDGHLVNDAAGSLRITIGEPDKPQGVIRIIEIIAIKPGDEATPIDKVDLNEGIPDTYVSPGQTIQGQHGSIGFWDISIPRTEENQPFIHSCFETKEADCVDPLVTVGSGEQIEVDTTHRITRQFDDQPLFVIATPTNSDGEEDFLNLATEISQSITIVDQLAQPSIRALGTVSALDTQIRQGTYVHRLGNLKLTFNIEDPIELAPRAIFMNRDLLSVQSGNNNLFEMTNYDPEFAPTAPPNIGDRNVTHDEFIQGLNKFVTVADTQPVTIGNYQGIRADISGLKDPSSRCDNDNFEPFNTDDVPCVVVHSYNRWDFAVYDDVQEGTVLPAGGQIYYFEELNLYMDAATTQAHAREDFVETLFTSMTIEPIN